MCKCQGEQYGNEQGIMQHLESSEYQVLDGKAGGIDEHRFPGCHLGYLGGYILKYNHGWIHSLEHLIVFTTNLLEGSLKI